MLDVKCIILNILVIAVVILSFTMCMAKTNAVPILLKKELQLNKTPGLVYVHFSADEVLYSYHGGKADIAKEKEITTAGTFSAYSVTKTMTAIAILQLADQGLLKLDSPASKYHKSFPYGDAITVRQLLTHTAGIPNPLPLQWTHPEDEHTEFNRSNFFKPVFAKHNKLKSIPGQKMSYSNLGYVLLGEIIEAVTGQTYEEYAMRNILGKLEAGAGLSFDIEPTLHVKGYQKTMSLMNIALGFMIDKKKMMGASEHGWKPFKLNYVNGTPYGGLIASADGLTKYGQTILNGRLLSESSRKMMFREHILPGGKRSGMCLSWYTGNLKGHRYVHHAGGGGGYYVELRLYPELNRGSIVMFNRSGMKDERYLDKTDEILLRDAEQ